MQDQQKTKSQLIHEIKRLRERNEELEFLREQFFSNESEAYEKKGKIYFEQIKEHTQKIKSKYRILFESSHDAIMTLAPLPYVNFLSCNSATLTMFKAKDECEFIATSPWGLSPKKQPDGELSSVKGKRMMEHVMEKGSCYFEWVHRTFGGEDFPASVLLTKVEVEKGKPFLQATVRDITEWKNYEKKIKNLNERLKELAYKDSLTGILNRDSIFDLIEKEIKRAEREYQKIAFLFIDINNFKKVNDNFGHHIGDKVLQKIANLLENTIRPNDFVGRIGGDEFLVLLPNVKSQKSALIVAKKIRDALDRKNIPEAQTIKIKSSIGITIYPEDGKEREELISKSDNAMYFAKSKEETNIAFYDSGKEKDSNYYLALKNALYNEEFRLHYQPIINRQGKVSFLEALIRWHSRNFEIRTPGEFLPLLEEYKQMKEVSYWTIKQILQDINIINKDDRFKNLPATLNLPCEEIVKKGFISEFKNILKANKDANLNNLMIEITEWGHNFNEQDTNIIEKLKEFKKFGIKILLDDFGAGYSSLINIARLPVDIIKIDKTLVQNLDSEIYSTLILDFIPILKKLNFKIIGEGVETKNQFEKLLNAGCDYFQGFYFAKPVYDIQNFLDKTNGFLIKTNE